MAQLLSVHRHMLENCRVQSIDEKGKGETHVLCTQFWSELRCRQKVFEYEARARVILKIN